MMTRKLKSPVVKSSRPSPIPIKQAPVPVKIQSCAAPRVCLELVTPGAKESALRDPSMGGNRARLPWSPKVTGGGRVT